MRRTWAGCWPEWGSARWCDTPPLTRMSILGWRLAGYAVLLIVALSFLLVGLNYGRLV